MKQEIFDDCLKMWSSSDGHTEFWKTLAEKWDYPSSESLRQEFKHARKQKGIKKEDKVIIQETKNGPRIGIIDLESLPILSYHFGLFDINIGIEQIVSDMCVLSWAGKFLNEPDIYSDILTSKEAPRKDDKRIVSSAHDFMSKCDIIVGHNWSNFDGKIFNTQFLLYGMNPVKYIAVDTLMVAKNNFRFSSNKLAFLNKKLGIRDKISNEGFPLWIKCHQGDQDALDEMMRYNVGDVIATESLFLKLRPYVKNINIALYNEIDEYQCPACGSTNLRVDGYKYLSAGKYESIRCVDCGSISRKKENLLSKDKRKSLLV